MLCWTFCGWLAGLAREPTTFGEQAQCKIAVIIPYLNRST